MRKAIKISLAFTIMLAFILPLAANQHPVAGLWKTIDDKSGEVRSLVRLWLENGKLYGRVEKSFPKPGEPQEPICDKCPPPFTDKPVIGLTFMWDFIPSGNKWVRGRVLDPEEGKIYNCELSLSEDGKSLRVYGYIRLLIKLGRSQTWLRAGD